uniref:polynucleotide adenylyltransferase n=1 Tax=Globodera rostochiensis TaxID=31243 RepID=A0A914I055_GLORO
MIELKISNIDFDISFAAIPGVDWLPKEPLGADEVELMMKFLAKQKSPQEAMLKALSGYLANKAIKKMVGSRNFSKFKNLLWATKFWAKSNHIYGNQLGFFNGISLAILCAKILFYYPNASVPFMLEKFMLIFSTWNWPMPVKIAENGQNDFEPFNWRPSAYRHFVVITCIVSVKQHILQFCGFVERKLRVQLLHFDQIMDSLVDYSHIKSDQQFGGNDHCPTKIRENNPRFRNPLCKIWLVGVKMKNAPMENNQKSSKNIKLEEYFDEILNKEIDTKIFEQYDAKVLKGWYQHIKMESKYVKWGELDGWDIQTKANE